MGSSISEFEYIHGCKPGFNKKNNHWMAKSLDPYNVRAVSSGSKLFANNVSVFGLQEWKG